MFYLNEVKTKSLSMLILKSYPIDINPTNALKSICILTALDHGSTRMIPRVLPCRHITTASRLGVTTAKALNPGAHPGAHPGATSKGLIESFQSEASL